MVYYDEEDTPVSLISGEGAYEIIIL